MFGSSSKQWFFLLAFLLFGLVSFSDAADYIVARAYFEDPSSSLTLEQVQSQRFTSFNGVFTKGYTTSAVWFKLRIDPLIKNADRTAMLATFDTSRLILRFRPNYLDEIQLFDPLQPQAQPRRTGDRYAWSQAEYHSLNFSFVIPRGDVPRDIWFRLKTTSSTLHFVEALSPGETQTDDMELHLTYSLLLSIQLLFVAWAALHYWGENRERVIGAFALKQGVGILFSLAYMGYARALMSDFLAPDWPDRWFSICIVSFVAVVIWFNYCLLKEYQPPKWGMRLQLIGVVFLPFEIVLILLDHVQVVLRFNMLMIVLSPILTLLLAITAKPSQGLSSPAVSQKAIIAINIFTLLTVSAQSLPAMGLTETFSLSRFNFLIHGVFNSFLMFLMLHVRAKRMEAQRRQTQTALTLAEQQTQQERQQRLEQSKFLSMLTHELKTPLSILRMVQGAKQVTPALALEADRAIQDMTDVIEHCVQSEKITDKKLNVTTEYVDPIEVLHALCGSVRYQSRLHVQAQALPILSTDPKLLRMLLGNLLDNAKKYSPEDSPIGVEAATETRGKVAGVRFSISNLPGKAGWPAVDKVFQKHYRSPGAHESTGCGLGLYLVEHIVQMLGGQVSYQPTASKIRFTLWIPA